MLKEHLTQAHDAASRRFEVIDRQVDWIHTTLLGGRSMKVLDLGCGPGLYTSRLARRGCSCTGIDFSPASIVHAKEAVERDHLDCRYVEGDIRTATFGEGYGLAMLIYGEFNVFRPDDAAGILKKAHQALTPGGILVLEPHPYEAIKELGQAGSHWYSTRSGLFSEKPHIYLEECFWEEASGTTIHRYYIVDAEDGSVTRYASTMQAYTREEFQTMLEAAGFKQIEFHPSLLGRPDPTMRLLQCITAMKTDE
jgi:SAM-dependent methyltransferase